VNSPGLPQAIKKVRAMKKPKWFTVVRDDAEWCSEGVPVKRKAGR